MKLKIKILAAVLVLITSSVIFAKQVSAQQPYVSFQVFYDQLSPYGQWVDYQNYGYAWIPYAGPDFFPYQTRGHWILTDYGWTWVSDYNWGWAPFHYGRWDYDNYYGWLWIPDYEWGPAWVSWRRAEGYYGWSPMEPGVSINISFDRDYNNHNDRWIFVQDRYIGRSDLRRYYAKRSDNERIMRNSTFIKNTYVDNSRHTTYFTGPDRESVQKVSGRSVKPYRVQENDRPGQDIRNGQYKVYRPQVTKNNEQGQKPAPVRVADRKDVRPPSERNSSTQQRTNQTTRNRQEQQPNTVNQQNNNSRPVQKRTETNSSSNRRNNQTNTVTPPAKSKKEQTRKVKTVESKK